VIEPTADTHKLGLPKDFAAEEDSATDDLDDDIEEVPLIGGS
jgi:hypothetical protein